MENHGFTRESLRKKFRLSEYLSQRIITGVAFLSITIIVLIFFFVFRETLPLFHQAEKISSTGSNEMVQEQYGVVTEAEESANRPEVYGIELDTALMGSRDYGTESSSSEGKQVSDLDLLGDEW